MRDNLKDYPGYYISKNGRLWSRRRNGKTWVKIKGQLAQGRLQYMMYKKVKEPSNNRHHKWGERTTYKRWEKASRLVAEAYLPNPNNLPIVMHLDNNPRHNYYKNLKWGTQKENIKQAVSDGRFNQCKRFGKDNPMYGKIGPMRGRKGINHPAYGNTSMLGKKLSEETKKKISISASLNIRIDYSKVKKLRIKGYSQQKIAKIMGIHQTSVSKILRKIKYG